MSDAGDIVTRVYSGFCGVDFRGEECSLVRSPDSLNIWKDYKEVDSIRTRPGLELLHSFSDPVYGIFFYNGMTLVHAGTKLYKDGSVLYSGLNPIVSDSFIFQNIWYFKDGKNYLKYDGKTIGEVVGYIPTTTIARKPAGGGTTYEDVNYLSPWRYNTFLADGESTEYVLDSKNLDKVTPVVTVDDVAVTDFSVDYTNGKITFTTAPTVPKTDGQDNVKIKFCKTVSGYADRIKKCTLLQVFDNRVFFSGNSDYPNTIYHCALDDPSYCSDLDYYHEGLDNAAVRGLVAGNNALWVFREPSQSNTTVFYHTPTIDSDYGKIYPSTHSNIATGCVGRAVNFNDDIVFFSDRGMEGISGDVTTEQVLGHRSSLVDRKLTKEDGYKDMILAEWEGYLLVFVGDKVYLADSRASFANNGATEYDWYYWELGKSVTCARVNNGVLYIGADGCVYTFTDNSCDVESYWITPKDKFKNPHKQKTTNKKSCTVEAEGSISVYAKSNKDEEFSLLGAYEVEDAFNCRIKVKKFKDLQLKFYSEKRFSLESATVEVIIGGYLKNL